MASEKVGSYCGGESLTLSEVNSILKVFGVGQTLPQVEPSLPEDLLGGCVQIEGLVFRGSTRDDIVNVCGMEQLSDQAFICFQVVETYRGIEEKGAKLQTRHE